MVVKVTHGTLSRLNILVLTEAIALRLSRLSIVHQPREPQLWLILEGSVKTCTGAYDTHSKISLQITRKPMKNEKHSFVYVRFRQFLCCADKRVVNIMKVYIERNKMQVELLIRFRTKY